jgi:BRCT domain type II-containing protein
LSHNCSVKVYIWIGLGTARGEICKAEKVGNSSKEESYGKQTSNRKKRRIKSNAVGKYDSEGVQPDNSPVHISDDEMFSDKGNVTPSPSKHKTTKLVSSSCNLTPHFTPGSLSANSLKHLQESPVLLGTSTQASDSQARKWSERTSPIVTPQHSLRKRIRHDS